MELDVLTAFVADVFRACGVPGGQAETAAEAIGYAEARGITSHGLSMVDSTYVPRLLRGEVSTAARGTVVRETAATALYDGARRLGLVVAAEAMDLAWAKARAAGVGLVAVRNSTHFGCAGCYADRVARRGGIGLVLSNCGRQGVVPPLGGNRRLLGTNPIAAAVPTGGEPFVLDMSTTVVPTGKVRQAHRDGVDVPPGWLYRADGSTTTDPGEFIRGTADVAWLGGAAATGAAKGYGLALLVELLAGALPGAGVGPNSANLDGDRPATDEDVGHLMVAIDPGLLDPGGAVPDRVGGVLDVVTSCPGVCFPGQLEARRVEQARARGIELSPRAVQVIGDLADRFGLPVPARTAVGVG
jgi:LDH2 family malate/lactate/ureidoglycolate dehydrogenase